MQCSCCMTRSAQYEFCDPIASVFSCEGASTIEAYGTYVVCCASTCCMSLHMFRSPIPSRHSFSYIRQVWPALMLKMRYAGSSCWTCYWAMVIACHARSLAGEGTPTMRCSAQQAQPQAA